MTDPGTVRVGFDTNILIYLQGIRRSPEDAPQVATARRLLLALSGRATIVAPVQALGEVFAVMTRTGASREEAREAVLGFRRTFLLAPAVEGTLLSALDCAAAHRMRLWDALILTAAAEAGCALLLSEDMHPGFAWRGCVVADPFAAEPGRRLAAVLA